MPEGFGEPMKERKLQHLDLHRNVLDLDREFVCIGAQRFQLLLIRKSLMQQLHFLLSAHVEN